MKLGDPGTLLLIVLAVTAGVLLVKSNRYFARQRGRSGGTGVSPEFSPSPERASTGWNPVPPYSGSAGEIGTLRGRDARYGPRDFGRIGHETLGLESLIAEAERAAARLEAAIARSAARRGTMHWIPPSPQKGTVPFRPSGTGGRKWGQSPARDRRSDREIGLFSISTCPTDRPSATSGGGEPLAAGARRTGPRTKIYALAEAGCDAAEIARRTAGPSARSS